MELNTFEEDLNKTCCNLLLNEFRSILNAKKINLQDSKISPEYFGFLTKLVHNNKLSRKSFKLLVENQL